MSVAQAEEHLFPYSANLSPGEDTQWPVWDQCLSEAITMKLQWGPIWTMCSVCMWRMCQSPWNWYTVSSAMYPQTLSLSPRLAISFQVEWWGKEILHLNSAIIPSTIIYSMWDTCLSTDPTFHTLCVCSHTCVSWTLGHIGSLPDAKTNETLI